MIKHSRGIQTTSTSALSNLVNKAADSAAETRPFGPFRASTDELVSSRSKVQLQGPRKMFASPAPSALPPRSGSREGPNHPDSTTLSLLTHLVVQSFCVVHHILNPIQGSVSTINQVTLARFHSHDTETQLDRAQ